VEKAAALFSALSDPTRLSIFTALLGFGEACVCQLHRGLGIPQSMASRHLRILYDAGLLDKRRVKQWMHYSVRASDDPFVRQVIGAIREAHCGTPEFAAVYEWMRRISCDDIGEGDS
jgi:ArsR family transcriptional regulator